MQVLPFTFRGLSGDAISRVTAAYSSLRDAYSTLRRAINANDYYDYITTVTADDDATLDIGDIDAEPYYEKYDFLFLNLMRFRPVTDGVELNMQYGGGGSWWTSAGYNYSNLHDSATGTTSIVLWPVSAVPQGNTANETMTGEIKLELASGSAEQGPRRSLILHGWTNPSGDSRFELGTGDFPTTSHVTAFRFFYDSGNIQSGKAVLYGIPVR